jgi:cephalosporin-C deacetylase-like acetyl esterase
MNGATIVFLLSIATIVVQAQSADDVAARAALFQYDKKASLVVKEISAERRGDVTVRDVTFIGVLGKPEIKAYLIVPNGAGPFAGILWVHWLGEEKSNRTQFLDEAVALAPKGVVSLLVDAMWATPKWFENRNLDEDYQNSVIQVIHLRRAMDLLLAQKDVDKARVGFVGHDYGGMYGMLAAGVDQQAKTYVYIAVTQSLNDWAFFANQPKSKAAYIRQNAQLEFTDFLRQVKNASTLFQFGKSDFYVSGADAAILFNATSQPKQRKLFDTGHKMDLKEIMTDRDDWLVKELVPKEK